MLRLLPEPVEDPGSDSIARCKAGNRFCSSLAAREDSGSEIMYCDICCGEAGFCRDCCCILCSQTIEKASEDYNSISCEADIAGGACGHSCHIDCALRAYMAGTVGGSIGLDAEYYCRRCDSRTDLVSHVTRLIKGCESKGSQDDIEKILNVGIRMLRGSNRASAQQLLHHIQLAMSKVSEENGRLIIVSQSSYTFLFIDLIQIATMMTYQLYVRQLESGSYPEDIWKKEDPAAVTSGISSEPFLFPLNFYLFCSRNSRMVLTLEKDHLLQHRPSS